MSQIIWRIATDTPLYQADDLSGAGAKATGGRWNQPGLALLYASSSRALACLETMVHLNAGGLPLNRYLVALTIPTNLWTQAQIATPETLPVGWDAQPPGQVSLQFGSNWARSRNSCLLIVPSALVPEEQNILINPTHPDAARITAQKQRRWLYDPRLSRSPFAESTM